MRISTLNVRFAPEQALMHAWLVGYPSYSLHRLQSFFEHVEYLAGGSLLTLDLSVMRTLVQKYWQAYSSYSMYADATITP